eukprot:7388038-Prymnesium_polylepis.2
MTMLTSSSSSVSSGATCPMLDSSSQAAVGSQLGRCRACRHCAVAVPLRQSFAPLHSHVVGSSSRQNGGGGARTHGARRRRSRRRRADGLRGMAAYTAARLS